MNIKKCLATTIILLFLGVAFAPGINADISKERMIKIPVTEYKSDGTREKTVVKLSWLELKELGAKLQSSRNPDERLSLYQEYDLIPQDVTLEKLREGMLSLAEKLNISEERLSSLGKSHKLSNDVVYGFGIDFFNELVVGGAGYLNLPIGLSFFIGIINYILEYALYGIIDIPIAFPSVDILQFYFFPFIGFLLTWHETEQVLDMWGLMLFCVVIGFVGFGFQIPVFSPIGSAFGASIVTIGLGGLG